MHDYLLSDQDDVEVTTAQLAGGIATLKDVFGDECEECHDAKTEELLNWAAIVERVYVRMVLLSRMEDRNYFSDHRAKAERRLRARREHLSQLKSKRSSP